nr:PREDICTED: cytokine receptor-like factor 3 [Bos mutus]
MSTISHPVNRLNHRSSLVSNREASPAVGPSFQGRWRFIGNHRLRRHRRIKRDSFLKETEELRQSFGSIDMVFIKGQGSKQSKQCVELLLGGRTKARVCRLTLVDDDFTAQDYRLQFRKCTSNHFEDVYVGSETEFIVLHIDPNVDYQFRVCARGDGRQEWSPWSVPQIGHSTLVPHEWTAGFEGYSLSSRRNIALRNDAESSGVLYSSAPTYFCGQTLTFRVETVGQPDRRDSIGVCAEKQNGYDSLQRDQAVCISTNGAVFVNGKEMTNQLPAVTSGSTVTFDVEAVTLGSTNNNEGGNFKLRVTISSNNREVVFDWLLDQSCGSLYFGCSFFYPGWKVLVF